MIGSTILHYKILEKLGEGGMGVVYKAEDTKLKREVAIKFLPHHISANEEERQRFEIEAQAAASLNHPNISTIYSIEDSDSKVFIVMEFIDGVELRDKIKTGSVPIDEAISIAVQIGEGLQAAHKKGIVHRDIKSGNIMITNDGKVKIMDFGLAKMRGGTQLTKVGSTVGTAAYMSPEQSRGDEVDSGADIWSFGVVLYEMLTGKMPFKGDYDQAIIYSILNDEPEPVNEIDEGLKHIISKSLAKNPDERYQTAGEIADELRTISEGGTVKREAKQSKLPWMIAGTIVILIAAVLYFFMPSSNNVEEKDKAVVKTIAVLPFTNLSTDPDQEYFADGMAEEIINSLVQIPGLKVSSRTSSFRFKGKKIDIQTIGDELGVGTVLEGSVRKSGNRLRITAQLINVSDGFNLWSNSYERELTDIFQIQDDLSASIVKALQLSLTSDQINSLNTRKITNIEAYNLYLKGRYYWNKRSAEGINKSMEYFQQAIDEDSTYAPAYAGLGDSYLMLGVYGRRRPNESISIAKSFIEKAVRLNNKLAEAYATLGDINIHYDWNLDAAESNLKKAIELNPQYASAYHWYSEVLVLRGEFEKAYKQSQNALEIDPYSLIINAQLGEHYQRGKEYKKAIDQLQKTIEYDSTFAYAYYVLGIVYVALKDFNRAVYNLRKANSLALGDTRILSALGFAEDFNGNNDEALHIKNELFERLGHQYVSSYDLAVITLGFGDEEQALKYLNQAYNEHGPWMPFLALSPLFDPLEKYPEFHTIIKKIGIQK